MEKRISELLSDLDASVIEFPESNVVSADRIKEITMKKINENKRALHVRSKAARIMLIAAAFVMALGICAGAYMGFTQHDDPAGVLHSFFEQESYAKGDRIVEYENVEVDGEIYEKLKTNMPAWERMPLDKAVAEKYIYPYVYGMGETMTWEDYTLTVEAMVYDAPMGCGLLYYTIENPKGVEGYDVWVNGEVNWPVSSPWYAAFLHPEHSYIDEEQTTDTKLYLCSYFVTVRDWGDFEIRLGDGGEFKRANRSTLILELPGEGMDSISLDGGNVTVSPIGMSVDKEALGLSLTNDIDHITLRFDDGSEYIVEQDDDEAFISNSAYAISDSDTHLSCRLFNSIIDIDSIAEVEIEGQVFKAE